MPDIPLSKPTEGEVCMMLGKLIVEESRLRGNKQMIVDGSPSHQKLAVLVDGEPFIIYVMKGTSLYEKVP